MCVKIKLVTQLITSSTIQRNGNFFIERTHSHISFMTVECDVMLSFMVTTQETSSRFDEDAFEK